MPLINGFSVNSRPSAIGVRTYRVPGATGVYLPVRSEVAPLLIGLAAEFHRTVEPLVAGWCWGFHYRAVTGGSSYSFHAAGIGIDLNAPRHPYGRVNTFSPPDRVRCRALAAKYGCRWGGDYRRVKDDMHFEVIVSRTAALALVRRLQTAAKPPSLPYFATGSRVIRLREPVMRGTDVRDVQNGLRLCGVPVTVDGVYGQGSLTAAKRFQSTRRLTPDGIVGPATLARIRAEIHR